METTPFSISLDAATASNNIEYLAINARYMSSTDVNETIETNSTTKILGLIKLGSSSTGRPLFELVENYLFNNERGQRRKHNLMGISSDHASNMISSGNKSLSSRLALDSNLQHLVIMHDLSHALNLVLKNSLK